MDERTDTLAAYQKQLQEGTISSQHLTGQCLDRIKEAGPLGRQVYLSLAPQQAFDTAGALDALREAGTVLSPLMGIPVSVKDLFDVAGEVTTAGSLLLRDAPPAERDAAIVTRLRRAGAVLMGRTNMTEFAYSGLGLNPHYGTPANPCDAEVARIPGGSSSGAGVSVAAGMACVAIGTDTGGSVRIPAAFCGLTGFKPTARRVPLDGAYPLSKSFDSIGPMAPSVDCCIEVDRILSGDDRAIFPALIDRVRFAIPQLVVMDDLDDQVVGAFARAVRVLEKAGAHVREIPMASFSLLREGTRNGGLVAAEAYAHHHAMLKSAGHLYDPRVSVRMAGGAEMHPGEVAQLLKWRQHFINETAHHLEGFDAMLFPTVAIPPPTMEELEDDDHYFKTNGLVLRNTSIINALDGCALSIPMHQPHELPMGLMIAGLARQDDRILSIGLRVEQLLQPALKG